MTDLTALAQGKLNDPILLKWALQRYRDAPLSAPQRREAMERAWFDDLSLRRWLDSDDQDMLADLFSQLPAERFANLGQAIGERWDHWGGSLAYHAAPVLARHAPGLAWKCFTAPEGKPRRNIDAILGMTRAIPLLPLASGRMLLGAIVEAAQAERHDRWERDAVLEECLSVGLQIDRPVAQAVIDTLLGAGPDRRRLDRTLDGIALGLFASTRYQQLASDIRKGKTQQRFQPLAALFRDEAPLDRLDRWSQGPVALADLTGLVDTFIDEADRGVILTVLGALRTSGGDRHGDRVADFLIGSVAAACERDTLDTSVMSLQQTVEILAVDLSSLPHEERLLTRLGAFEPAAIAAVLVDRLEREKATYGGVTLARVMGSLGWEAFVPSLIDAMNDASGDLLCEAARDALAVIGEPARDRLIALWDQLDGTQRIYGLSVIAAVGGDPVASFALDPRHNLLQEDAESWCRLAVAAPDPRVVARLEQQLPRQQDLLDEAFYVLVRLLDLTHPQLAAVGERIRQRRDDQQARTAAFAQGEWFQDTLNLALRCPECGGINHYVVRRVAIDPADPSGQPLLAQDLACASCTRWTDLAFTAEAKLVVTAELVAMAANSDGGLAGKGKVLTRPLVPLKGRPCPVGEVIAQCRAAVAEEPASIGDWVRLAYCYQQVLTRPRFGVQYSNRALSLEAHAVEAVILKADVLTIEGKDAQAFALLDQALAAKDHWRFFLPDVSSRAGIAAQFANFYNTLLRRLGRTDRASLHATFLGPDKKVGRNDPCPCGSGKKYKKCCLAVA